MSAPEQQIIISYFYKTLSEYYDAILEMTDLFDTGKMPDETLLNEHINMVARKRMKLVTTVQSARYHYNSDLSLVIPNLYLHGGIC